MGFKESQKKSQFKVEKLKQAILKQRNLVKNFGYLSLVQLLNLLLPLATYPYLIRILGASSYGLLVFIQTIMLYLVIAIKFGFNISATKDISINIENREKVSEITSSVYIIKTLIGLLVFTLLAIFTIFIPTLKQNILLIFLTAHICLYEIVFPIWYFQGIEKMKYIAIINFVSRSISTILIFCFIKVQTDIFLVPLFNGVGTLVAGILSFRYIFYIDKVRFYFPSTEVILTYIKNSTPFFVSQLSTQLYTNANKVFIGIFLNMKDVALYDLADKLTTLFKIPISLIGQTIYPQNVKRKDVNFIKKLARYTLIPTIFVYILIFIFSKTIVVFIAGTNMFDAIGIVKVLTFSVIPITAGHFFCTQTLIPFGHTKSYMTVLTFASIFYFVLILIAFYFNIVKIYQLAIITILTQLYISFHSYYLIKYRYKIW